MCSYLLKITQLASVGVRTGGLSGSRAGAPAVCRKLCLSALPGATESLGRVPDQCLIVLPDLSLHSVNQIKNLQRPDT